jgi:hypothetical protein
MNEPKRHCVICEEKCEKAPTKRGWTAVRYDTGIHFDCALSLAWSALRVCETEDVPIPNELFAEMKRKGEALDFLASTIGQVEWIKISLEESGIEIDAVGGGSAPAYIRRWKVSAPDFLAAIERANEVPAGFG